MSTVHANQAIAVDKNIPLPERVWKGHNGKYPFHELNVGDSFLFPAGIKKAAAASACAQMARRANRKFSIRVTDQGIRCWRVE